MKTLKLTLFILTALLSNILFAQEVQTTSSQMDMELQLQEINEAITQLEIERSQTLKVIQNFQSNLQELE